MSVEALTVASVVENGGASLRRLYATGISVHDFALYDDEFRWVERRLAQRKPLNRRVFRAKFPDFEWNGVPSEDIADLAAELKEERAFEEVTSVMATLSEQLEKDNALELAVQMREHLSLVTRKFHPMSDIDLDDNIAEVIESMRQGMILAKQGMSKGIPTGFPHLDHHWGGFMPGIFVEILGRTGEGKSYKTAAFGWSAKKAAFTVGIFSPEFNAHEVRCRYHTLASADKQVQADLGLERSFRNRALLFQRGFNLKSYQHFMEYMHEQPGRMHMLSAQGMHDGMTVGYVEDRIVELELDLVIVDPIYMLKPVRTTRDGNGWQETAWTAEALHTLGERYGIPIVFTNQANDKTGAKEDAPHKSAGFGSQQMTHLSDYVLGVKHLSDENRMICRGSKSRFGQGNFRYELKFYANTGVIKDLTPLGSSYYNGNDEDVEEDEVRAAIENATRMVDA